MKRTSGTYATQRRRILERSGVESVSATPRPRGRRYTLESHAVGGSSSMSRTVVVAGFVAMAVIVIGVVLTRRKSR